MILMTHPRHWLLPLLLTATQLALWPLMPAVMESAPTTATDDVTAALIAVVVGLALCLRRVAPLRVLAVAAAGSVCGLVLFPAGELSLIGVAQYVALYSVAVRSPGRYAVAACAVVVLSDSVTAAVTGDAGIELLFSVATSTATGLLIAALGRSRRRWHADRAAAAERLAAAEARGRQAADAERHRLARELHDVTAHHLTSIVVTASAAQRLADSRPELTAEALRFAARTGRETLAALHRLVTVMQTPDEEPPQPDQLLEELADGFRLLGQQVSVEAAPGAVPPAHAAAVHGIAREALTNTLRYAPGSAVRVRLTRVDAGIDLTVEDDGPTVPGASAGLGSGRGLTGMAERATALGGSVHAGPRPEGGWRVRATLPSSPIQRPRAAAPWWRRMRSAPLVDVTLAGATLLLPVALVLAEVDGNPTPEPGRQALFVLLLVAHGLPLLWRRHAPWWVLGAVSATTLAWPVLTAAQVVRFEDAYLIVLGSGAELAAVWAVAVYARSAAVTWLGPLLCVGATGTAAALVFLVHEARSATGDEVGAAVFGAIMMWLVVTTLLGVPAFGLWAAGAAMRRRRTRQVAGEHTALAVATARAVESARAERFRVAAGLRDAVLHRTAAVAGAADAGDVDAVLAEARAALASMRGLLNGLRDDRPAAQPNAPQPTTAGIATLCGQRPWVSFELTGTPRPLPADVDVSAYRVVELLLGGGERPTSVRLHHDGGQLRLTVAGSIPDADGATAAGLRARVAAVGGTIDVDPSGTVDVRLPAPTPAPSEEVAPSPSV
jgi:signal transduction histidine kinase